MFTEQKSKFSTVKFSPKEVDFNAIIVIYLTEEGKWRGFVHPYGETTEADTKGKAIQEMRELTQAYADIVKKYSYPSHLMNVGLSDIKDHEVFNNLLQVKSNMEKLLSKKGKVDTTTYYAETFNI